MYAIVENGSKQYRVEVGTVVKFEKLNAEVGSNGHCSLVHGWRVKSNYPYQKVFGKWNDNKQDTLLEIGCGTYAGNRKNAFEVTNTGIARAYGKPVDENDIVRLQDIIYTSVEDIKSIIWG